MKKFLFYLMILPLAFSCNQEDELKDGITITKGLNVSADFINLANTGNTENASFLTISSNEKDVTVKWITGSSFNIDTAQTVISMKNGQGVLPIKWQKKQENGSYAPNNMMFKAGVVLTAGELERFIPLYYVQSLDSAMVTRSIQTRVEESNNPKASSIDFLPLSPSMSDIGAILQVRLTNLSQAAVDYSSIKSYHNIDINPTDTPTELVEGINTIKFNWKDANVRPAAFKLPIVFSSFELEEGSAIVMLNWNPGTSPEGSISYASSTLPTGNIPQTGGTYDFFFTATNYTGSVQVNAFDTQGNVLGTGNQGTDLASTVTVPANTTGSSRNVIFKYKIDGNNNWQSLPDSTLRVQDGQGTTPPQPGSPSYGPISPTGDIPDAGGDYNCVFSNYAGQIYFQAVSGQGRLLAETSDIIPANGFKQIFLTIPEAKSLKDNIVIFQYSTDGKTWTTMETRTQIVESFGSGYIHNLPKMVPVTGGTYTYTSQGSLSGILTILCQDSKQVVLSESKGAAGGSINVVVPANTTGEVRTLFFYLKRKDQPDKAYIITHTQQSAE
ncbi:hypothetical protein [Bacteroides sp.]|uniref:hypothetical protein n=1 Tax=Bacteroides sp. TaxID=29523 RepID=UPI002A7F2643|nr:hypothetical protein [Bacteroides sp.]